jgi:hypothetical protein
MYVAVVDGVAERDHEQNIIFAGRRGAHCHKGFDHEYKFLPLVGRREAQLEHLDVVCILACFGW